MLTQKQYLSLLVVAIGIFGALFFATYLYTTDGFLFNTKSGFEIEDVFETPINSSVTGDSSIQVVEEKPQKVTILPTTLIELIVRDQDGNLVTQEIVDPYSLMGLSEEEVASLFSNYNLIKFDSDNVILEGETYIEPERVKYYLGVRNDEIGIILEDEIFQEIGIQASEFSSYINTLLKFELISVDYEQKALLERNPYYIESILQNLTD
ncbi:MAG: hypothetical protein ATN36_09035 [Epulopiscium sp. Nele67-Bin005]|nr:MAG: hypothetical protein ATN36_09035 [Epulopiscium sp. Nele67-Bin005]